ncbi:GNAT family N-acetyltransferase [Brevundimonas sp.]|uniref:GNAT family N-acetyltransferase n=1 Tax=Brevundimonas sp. TaxID=1871086 RepID=UPI00391B8D77
MTDFRDVAAENRFEQGFTDTDGDLRRVWADYAKHGDSRVILHVEADPQLRGSGAAGDFMKCLADHARDEGLSLIPRCAYAVAWFRRHPEAADVVSDQ